MSRTRLNVRHKQGNEDVAVNVIEARPRNWMSVLYYDDRSTLDVGTLGMRYCKSFEHACHIKAFAILECLVDSVGIVSNVELSSPVRNEAKNAVAILQTLPREDVWLLNKVVHGLSFPFEQP